jgi:hypothetical protein
MKHRILMIATIVLLTGSVFGQDASSEDRKTSMIRSIVRDSGWEIPGLSPSRITDPRKPLPAGYGVPGVGLNITVLKPTRQFVTTISLFGLKPDGTTLVMGERRGAVKSIIKCDIDNRVFVYIVQFVALVHGANGRIGYGGIYGAQYFDHDGDGIFESYEPGAPFVTPELRIPDWARHGK